jgi:histidinol-phosphate aminotransferase
MDQPLISHHPAPPPPGSCCAHCAARAQARPSLQPRRIILEMTPYDTGPMDPDVDLYLDENEGPPVAGALEQALTRIDPQLLRRYPDADSLRRILAKCHGVAPEHVFVSAGVDDALDRFCRAFLEPGRQIVLPLPTFAMLGRYATLAGAETVPVPWPRGPYPIDQVIRAITARTAAIALVSPNNPTGAVATAGQLERLSAAAPHALIVCDLAYAEFAEEDLTPVALRLPNTLTLRTLSKAWGLAGLRIGYAIGPAQVLEAMRIAGPVYPVAAASIAIAADHLDRGAQSDPRFIAQVRGERDQLVALLTDFGADPLEPQGNFVLAFFRDAAAVRAALRRRGIAVHGFPTGHQLEQALRITCPGDARHFARLCDELKSILGQSQHAPASIPGDAQ